MALPTGTILMSEVNVEVGRAPTATTSLNDTIVRQTAASTAGPSVLSGTISMNNLRGAKGTQVIPGVGGGFRFNAGRSYTGYDSTSTSAGLPYGSWSPTPVLNLMGGQIIEAFYVSFTSSGPVSNVWRLTLNTTTSYTGSIKVYGSLTVNDPWPTIPIKTIAYAGANRFWADGGPADSSIVDLNSSLTLRFEKA